MKALIFFSLLGTFAFAPGSAWAQALPQAVVDLRTREGAALVGATWRYSDVSIIQAEHRDPGSDLRASGQPNRTNDIVPHGGAADFDDSSWEIIEPSVLYWRGCDAELSHGVATSAMALSLLWTT